ncbi:1,6-anhydro-N-acetylmuramyl-L-alanine amidase AmpD [Algibacillus agarilyticus]|uniref:1,6-anhydro-N-acetylmuramyl-L-alanine amidase AmpD n=1 Tax=Algibacillus agarilyticus TaxID=2234133 RepID=UPI000DCFA461|nr:1,6-anhydro-N-acetylmuramyl-L-alanine amidase AmpD [Algibacillus agarilyticus]
MLTKIDKQHHILSSARVEASSFFNERPVETDISLLVIHNISLPAGQFGLPYVNDLFMGSLDCTAHPSFCDLQGVEVSSHLFIQRDGQITQYVPFNKRAWHAGVSVFGDKNNCNDFSIGIELEGTDSIAYTAAQYDALVVATLAIMRAYPAISLDRIVGHCDIAPGRKTDPGVAFDWRLYKSRIAQL